MTHDLTISQLVAILYQRRLVAAFDRIEQYLVYPPFSSMPLHPEQRLADIGVGDLSTLFVRLRVPGGARPRVRLRRRVPSNVASLVLRDKSGRSRGSRSRREGSGSSVSTPGRSRGIRIEKRRAGSAERARLRCAVYSRRGGEGETHCGEENKSRTDLKEGGQE